MISVWHEAVSDYNSLSLHGEGYKAYMYRGIKIVRIENDIRIYYGNLKAIDYIEIGLNEYEIFRTLGYRVGTHKIVQDNYRAQISIINEKIKEEVNTRNNKKHYNALKMRRDNLINKYSEISKTN